MRAHSSLRLGTLHGTTPELLASPCYCAWGFCMVWEAGLPHKTSSAPPQRRNGRACSGLTARGCVVPVGVISSGGFWGYRPCLCSRHYCKVRTRCFSPICLLSLSMGNTWHHRRKDQWKKATPFELSDTYVGKCEILDKAVFHV